MGAIYNPPAYGKAFVFYDSLISQANTKIMQVNPTLAAGDVKIAKNDGAPVNLATLPVVDGDFTKRIKIALSAAEMKADNLTLIFSDAAGDEWADLTINIQPSKAGASMTHGTIDNTVAPTSTVFECDDITEATGDHFIGKIMHFITGALIGQATKILDYALVSGRGRFTVELLTDTPANDDEIVIV